jgi:hypothetical protein
VKGAVGYIRIVLEAGGGKQIISTRRLPGRDEIRRLFVIGRSYGSRRRREVALLPRATGV